MKKAIIEFVKLHVLALFKKNADKELGSISVFFDSREPAALSEVTCMNFDCPFHLPDRAECNAKYHLLDKSGKCITFEESKK